MAPARPGDALRPCGSSETVQGPALLERACVLQQGFRRVQADLLPEERAGRTERCGVRSSVAVA